MKALQRLCAFVLAFALSFPLWAPLLAAASETKLPACCRRDGRHSCFMGMKKSPGVAMTNSAGPGLRKAVCAQFPTGKGTPIHDQASVLATPPAAVALAPDAVILIAAQMEARFRISFARTSQKRGPPAPYSA